MKIISKKEYDKMYYNCVELEVEEINTIKKIKKTIDFFRSKNYNIQQYFMEYEMDDSNLLPSNKTNSYDEFMSILEKQDIQSVSYISLTDNVIVINIYPAISKIVINSPIKEKNLRRK